MQVVIGKPFCQKYPLSDVIRIDSFKSEKRLRFIRSRFRKLMAGTRCLMRVGRSVFRPTLGYKAVHSILEELVILHSISLTFFGRLVIRNL
jgi:hypothetical protein